MDQWIRVLSCIQSSKGSRHISFLAIMLSSRLWRSVLRNRVIALRKVSYFDVARVLESHKFYYARDLEVSSGSSTPIFPFTTQVSFHGCNASRDAAIRAPSTTACYALANQSCQYEIQDGTNARTRNLKMIESMSIPFAFFSILKYSFLIYQALNNTLISFKHKTNCIRIRRETNFKKYKNQ